MNKKYRYFFSTFIFLLLSIANGVTKANAGTLILRQPPEDNLLSFEGIWDWTLDGRPGGEILRDLYTGNWSVRLALSSLEPLLQEQITLAGIGQHVTDPHPEFGELNGGETFTNTSNLLRINNVRTNPRPFEESFRGEVTHGNVHLDQWEFVIEGQPELNQANSYRGIIRVTAIHTVPEPSTILGLGITLGAGIHLKGKYKQREKT
jgi:hypothetical protein